MVDIFECPERCSDVKAALRVVQADISELLLEITTSVDPVTVDILNPIFNRLRLDAEAFSQTVNDACCCLSHLDVVDVCGC